MPWTSRSHSLLAISAVFCFIGSVGCGQERRVLVGGDADGSEGCQSGERNGCTCADGASGNQLCGSDRTYGACRCSGAADGGSEVGDTGSDTSASDTDSGMDESNTADVVDGTVDVSEEPDADAGEAGGTEDASVDETALYRHESFEQEMGWFESIRVPSNHRDEALTFVEDPVREGEHAIRLHAKNPDEWDYSGVNNERVEIGTHANRWKMWNDDPPFNTVGEPIWFSFSVYVPEDWEYYLDNGSTETINIAEFHANLPGDYYEGDWTPGHRKPWTMNIWDDEFVFRQGFVEEGSGSKLSRATTETAKTDIERGRWHDVVVHVEWADDEDSHDGFMKIWVNDDKIYDHEGPTILDSESPPRPLKLSIYNGQWDGSDSYVSERTLYFDDVRFARNTARYEDLVVGKQ